MTNNQGDTFLLCIPVMPKIDMTNIPQKIVHVHRGKPIDLNIPIKAKPPPVCSWSFGGIKLKDSLDRIKIDSNGKYTHLVIRETTINDTGDYTLEVKNAVGIATEVIKVIILGKTLCTQMKATQVMTNIGHLLTINILSTYNPNH